MSVEISPDAPRPVDDELRLIDQSEWATQAAWTEEQIEAVDRLTTGLAEHRWATAGFLVGSLSRGTCDRYSDVDYHVVADPRDDWRPLIQHLIPEAYIGEFGRAHEAGFPVGVMGLLDNGQKIDIFVHDPREFDILSLRDHLPLFDTARSRFASVDRPAPSPGFRIVDPYFPDHAVQSFYQAIEVLSHIINRNETYLAFRNCHIRLDVAWIPLLLAENGVDRYLIGKRRMASYLSPEQSELLAELMRIPSAPLPEMAQRVRAELFEFASRGQQLAGATGATWPSRLQDIVERKFERASSEITESSDARRN